jgi:hypothetical protein
VGLSSKDAFEKEIKSLLQEPPARVSPPVV